MAFFNKAGNILRQTVSKHINHEMSANSSIFQMIRCMSSSKVFVGGLSFSTDEQSLGEAFNAYGQVQEARVIVDRETGRSRGFGFVTFADPESASAAIQAMDQRELHGRMVRVNYANDRQNRGGGGYGGGYGGGGYGGGGYGGGGYGGGGYGAGGGGYGGGGYGAGGGGYGGGGGGYGGGNNYGSGGDVGYGANSAGSSYGGEGQNSSVAGGFGANDGFASGGPDAGNSFASSGGGFNSGDQFGSNGSSNIADAPVDNDEPEDFARRA